MSTRKRQPTAGVMRELWRPPANAGDPIGCLATTYTFDPGLFDEQCLARFLEIESEPDREDLAFLLERESRLGSVYAGVLVDHTQAGVQHSLRWDVLPVRVRAGKQHAKLSLLAWSQHVRIIVASANLTEPGYRSNHEVAAAVDLSPAESDGDLLMQAVTLLRGLLALVPGVQDDTPVVRRASTYLSQVERQTEAWRRPRRRKKIRRQLACTLPTIEPGTDARSSLAEAAAVCRQRGRAPHEAWVASPFFDVDDDSGRVAAALCKSMARGRARDIRFYVPASRDDGETAVPRLAAPKAIATTPLKYRGHVTVSSLPDVDGDKNVRRWHAKMLAFKGENYAALMIGSSNFTCAGLGAASHRNAEANLVTVVERVAYGREARMLEAIWSQMGPDVDVEAAEWLGSKPELDEEAAAVAPPVPAGFVSATYRAGDNRTIVLRLFSERLPPEWRIHSCGQDAGELLTRSEWAESGSGAIVTLRWSPFQPPERLLVSWDGQEAFLPLNVEDAHLLPPPARLEQMSADDMLWILAAADPSAAIRAWARRRQPSDPFDPDLDSATPIDLDPLRRNDLHATFLHRIRRRARILAQLRANLQRPVWGRQALEWRLRGMIGVQALADRLVREIAATTEIADEALLTLADFLIVLREVDYEPAPGCLSKPEFDSEFRAFLRDLADGLQEKIAAEQANVSPELMDFWRRVLEQCR